MFMLCFFHKNLRDTVLDILRRQRLFNKYLIGQVKAWSSWSSLVFLKVLEWFYVKYKLRLQRKCCMERMSEGFCQSTVRNILTSGRKYTELLFFLWSQVLYLKISVKKSMAEVIK